MMISIGLFSLMTATIQYRMYGNDLRKWYPGDLPLSLAGVAAALISLLGLLGFRRGYLQDVTVNNCQIVSTGEEYPKRDSIVYP
jgi:hypothetical protein